MLVSTVARADVEAPRPKTEIGAIPLVGGDSDIGFGGGALGSVTRLEPGLRPYLWRLEGGGAVTFKHSTEAGWSAPYQDVYLLWTDPHLIRDRFRVEVRPSYTAEKSQLYYGIGNAASAPYGGPDGQNAAHYFRYGRVHPTLQVRLRIGLGRGLYALTGAAFTYNRIDIHADSKLESDVNAASDPMRASFRSLAEHGVALFEYGIIYDTRDNEMVPSRGGFHQLKLRMSPGGTPAFPYRYGQVNAMVRLHATPVPRWLTIGLRLVVDAQFGDPPFYELARYEDTFAIGGGKGVRGIPAQRYYGKIKAFGNLEARSEILTVNIRGKDYALGIAAFFDAGRVWSDWSRDEARDGTGIGLKWGAGGGLRFRQGDTFVVRGDVAWSPDARPIGAYFTAGHIF